MSLLTDETIQQRQGLKVETRGAGKVVEVGSVVTVQFPDFNDPGKKGEISRLVLVDSPIIDPESACLLYANTPIGLAILGKKEGDIVRVELKDRIMSYDLTILVVR